MRIVIDTDGNGSTTRIEFNGREQKKLKEFNLSVKAGKKIKIQKIQEINGEDEFMSYFGEDLMKMDEVYRNTTKENSK